MSKTIFQFASLFLALVVSIVVGYAIYELSGRNVVADFVRPFLAIFAICLSSFLLLISRHKIAAFINIFLFGCIPAVISLLTYCYYLSIGAVFTGDDVVAIAQSNSEEIWDFFSHYILNTSSLLITLITTALFILFTYCLCRGFSLSNKQIAALRLEKQKRAKNPLDVKYMYSRMFLKGIRMQALLGAILLFATSMVLYTQLRPISYYRLMTNDLEHKLETFNHLVKELENSPQYKAQKSATGELYVLIIGESLSCDSMGLYNESINNTPFLSKLAKNGRTVVFPNAYSSFVNTVPSITASFSQGNLQTGLTFPQGANLLSMARQAGITTYWISNQVKNGNADTPIGAISALADHSYFTTNFVFDGSYSQQPDMILLPKLKETFDNLDSTKNNLVIIHLMGNHSPYYNRYPDDFPEIQLHDAAHIGALRDAPEFTSSVMGNSDYENYLTSIKYNDFVLQEFYKLFASRPDFQAMLYYSDHGEALLYDSAEEKKNHKGPAGRHNVAQFSYAMTRIPLLISFSEQFQTQYPNTVKALFQNKEAIFTNDTLYDLMLDLMQVKSKAINYSLSMASLSYSRPEPEHIMLLNNKSVGKDPDYLVFKHARLPFSNQIAVRNANALFKAHHALSKGYKVLHINTMLKDDKLYVQALKHYNRSFLELKEYFAQIPEDIKLIVQFDGSDLNKHNTQEVLAVSDAIGKAINELSYEQQKRIYFISENEVLLNYLASYLEEHIPPEHFEYLKQESIIQNNNIASTNENDSNLPQVDNNISLMQQQQIITKSHSWWCKNTIHAGFPSRLGWIMSNIKQLSTLDVLPKSIHYVVAEQNVLSDLSTNVLCGRHVIIMTTGITLQDADFAYKMAWLRSLLQDSYIIVNYFNAFDSDFQ